MESTALTSGFVSAAHSVPAMTRSEKKERRNMLVHPLDQVIAYTQRVGHDRQRRINCRARREEASVNHVQVIDFMSPAVGVQHGIRRIVAEAAGSGLLRDSGQGTAIPDTGLQPHNGR